jgi:hypothetical protein
MLKKCFTLTKLTGKKVKYEQEIIDSSCKHNNQKKNAYDSENLL